MDGQIAAKPTKTKTARRERRGGEDEWGYADDGRNKVHLAISDKAYETLGVHAHMAKVPVSAIVDTLVCRTLKRFVVQDRQKPRSASSEGDVNPTGENLPIGETVISSPEESAQPNPGEGEGSGASAFPPPALGRKRKAG